jgi:hypothetical protein
MPDSYRRHVATRREIIFVPYEVGTVKNTRYVHPPHYPQQDRSPWRPATRPPTKAERLIEFLRRVQKQTEDARSMLRPDARLLKAWFERGELLL